mmetsp:Transcript_28626/g.59467  ORF Transcript_28626/g.59467 Transcript_28626/m.59467 type:complete len:86 (+) Transcript_28626:256-513(+)
MKHTKERKISEDISVYPVHSEPQHFPYMNKRLFAASCIRLNNIIAIHCRYVVNHPILFSPPTSIDSSLLPPKLSTTTDTPPHSLS